ncbi:beta-ketoacyl-ACP synthase II [Parasphaerochaeta coccoides]|uniref:3-oxoacyl-[acyl-carrier-protein] synthase 2 n=1 Tax=Parasphaerochaeta coccoides (strain ATCC BAA-1237 / DSM 17374 / SPN1) TaxID=760011 RepID=F4GJL5_PARC1|nr:beta-ketoacyl-ACP synthase II [Parasphaerochaeta coccoides]AEC02762.1 3-oxoacyl-(acyl-carrier-protein) synthase II [Parasphaerochaeta coccoides DSM 17374]
MSAVRRVVVTGMGIVSPLGNRIDTFWDNIHSGICGIGPLDRFDVSDYPARIAGQVRDFDYSDLIESKAARSMADFTIYAVYAAIQAMEQAGFEPDGAGGWDPFRSAVHLGNGIGGFEVVEDNLRKLFERGPRSVSPLTIPKLITNEGAGNIAMRYGIKGPALTIATACASGTDAVGAAFHAVRHGQVDMSLTGGSEGAITQLAVSGFCRLHALSTAYNDTPLTACRPFDATRDGFILGEGAGMLVLEELSHARARGARILGEITGYGATCDAYHLTSPNPDGDGAMRAMKAAIDESGIPVEKIDYINAHGTSTPVNDVIETKAIKRLFGDHAYKLRVSSTKSMTSHMVGAAGAVEAIVSLLALKEQFYPCTLNLNTPDPACDLDYVPNTGVEDKMTWALSESLGFGGHNGALVFRRYEE